MHIKYEDSIELAAIAAAKKVLRYAYVHGSNFQISDLWSCYF